MWGSVEIQREQQNRDMKEFFLENMHLMFKSVIFGGEDSGPQL